MVEHTHDENSAPNQHDSAKPTVRDAQLAKGIPGAEPPLEGEGAVAGHRHEIAASWASIYETMHYGIRDMGAKRSVQLLLKVNQKDGFDCPSCAWPDPTKRKTAEFCENGVKAIASEATTTRATPEFFAKHSIAYMLKQTDFWLDQQGRITHPMIRRPNATHYEPISWEDAFKLIGSEINKLSSPNEASFYTSGRASNEAAFMYGLFARQFGTNNLPDCSNMCHESSGLGLTETIGIGKATVTIDDFSHADCIFVTGQNPGSCHPRMLTELQAAVRNGCKIVSVNPLLETGMMRFKNPQEPIGMFGTGTQISCLHLPVRINGDVALYKGIMKRMLEEDERTGGKILDHDFILQDTEGFEAFAADIRAEQWEDIIRESGVSRDLIHEAAKIASNSKRMICSWAMGLTQHKNGVANIQTIVNFALLRGQIGRKGAGVCPVRGHSNVQGDRTVGIWEKMSKEFLETLGKEFNFNPPSEDGFDTVCTIEAMHDGRVKVFVGLGGNFLSATPDTRFTSEAMQKCRLTVQISTKINRGHLITGEQALILPCLGRTERDVQKSGEQFVTVEDTTCTVHSSIGRMDPASEHLKSEPAIIAGIAIATLGHRSSADWQGMIDNYDKIREHIEHVVPGFTQFNKRVREPGGFNLPNGPRDGKFTTESKKAKFTIHPLPKHALTDGRLLLTTLRSHDQFNTTIYSESDRYRGISNGRRVIFMNKDDIAERNFKPGDWVDLISHFEDEDRKVERFKIVSYEIPKGCTAAYYPETNPLVALRDVAVGSNQPASKSLVISIRPADASS